MRNFVAHAIVAETFPPTLAEPLAPQFRLRCRSFRSFHTPGCCRACPVRCSCFPGPNACSVSRSCFSGPYTCSVSRSCFTSPNTCSLFRYHPNPNHRSWIFSSEATVVFRLYVFRLHAHRSGGSFRRCWYGPHRTRVFPEAAASLETEEHPSIPRGHFYPRRRQPRAGPGTAAGRPPSVISRACRRR